MATSTSNIVKTTNPPNDDFFLCRAFAKAISSEKILQIIEQQPITTESSVDNTPSNENIEMIDISSLPTENTNQWKISDLCLCPFSEDGLLYPATIIHIDSSSCTVLFDDYGNEEIHPLTDLQIRTEEDEEQQQQQQEQEAITSINEDDILPPAPPPPPLPPFPTSASNEDNDALSSTLMSWYLAGYHTGFYQGIKEKK